ncbi:MAG: asparagine synthase (glutamine-hydrolyzing) [Nitrospinales bacterium]
MCGIAGILTLGEKTQAEPDYDQALKRMLNSLGHRGPDDRGEEKISLADGQTLHLGHRRLSIIDLSSLGHQPMSRKQSALWISTNSEIYNYRELREELRPKHHFRSQSDTEVLLAAYEEWGVNCLEKLRGMFAFAIWDASRQRLFLARDRLGIKPLYYYSGKDCFVFASEVRAIRDSKIPRTALDPTGLYHYLSFGRLQAPETLLSSIRELKPARYLLLRPQDGKIEENEYWRPTKPSTVIPLGSNIKEEIGRRLVESVRLRLVSDVPVGSFLSGGIDSSAISGLASDLSDIPIKTLSIVFKEKEFDESEYSSLVAHEFGTDHHCLPLEESDLLDALPTAIAAMDQPTVDGVNTYLISRCARESGLKVVLSGLGGDELFAGYDSFRILPLLMRWEKKMRALPRLLQNLAGWGIEKLFPLSDKNTKMAHFITGKTNGRHLYYLYRALFCENQIEGLLADKEMVLSGLKNQLEISEALMERLGPLSVVDQISYLELTHYMSNMLLRDTDMMSMAHGLEVRVPLIDQLLVELMFSLPGHLKLNAAKPKPLLVDSLPHKLPDAVVLRKKMGFTLPFEQWMHTRLKDEMESVLLTPVAPLKGILSEPAVARVWRNFLDGQVSWARPWSLYILKKWVERNV